MEFVILFLLGAQKLKNHRHKKKQTLYFVLKMKTQGNSTTITITTTTDNNGSTNNTKIPTIDIKSIWNTCKILVEASHYSICCIKFIVNISFSSIWKLHTLFMRIFAIFTAFWTVSSFHLAWYLCLSADYALYTIHAFFSSLSFSLSHFFLDVERSFVFDDNNNSIYYMNNFMAVSVFENSIELYRIHGECRKFFFLSLLLFACSLWFICVGIVIGIHYIRFHLLIICFLLRFSLNKLMQTFITEWALFYVHVQSYSNS